MESKQPMISPSDEIDLFELFSRLVLFVRKNFIILIISFLVGSGLGLTFYKITPSVFGSKMLISSDILTESYSKSLIDNLVKLIKENNFQSISKELNLTPDQAASIAGLDIKSAIEKTVNMPEKDKIFLNIEAKSKDNSIWPQLESGLIQYFGSNEFVRVRVEQKRNFYSKIIEKINSELEDLEKLKARISQGDLGQSTKDNLILFDPTMVNTKIIDLNKEKISFQNSLETVNSVQVVEGFTIFNKPESPKLSISLVAGAAFGLFIAGLVIASKAVRMVLKSS